MGAGSCGKGGVITDGRLQGHRDRGGHPGNIGVAGFGGHVPGGSTAMNPVFGGDFQFHAVKPTRGTFLGIFRIRRGCLLDKYSVVDTTLGSGYFGYTKLVVSRFSGVKYVVKSFVKADWSSRDRMWMLINETQIYLRLDHPHIAKLIEVWEDSSNVHLVMEYCAGGLLYDRLCTKKRFSEDEARTLVTQMLSVLLYLHSHHIIHRDIKVDNWLFESTSTNSRIKCIDFGFSKIWPTSKSIHATCGTLAYTSPDKLLGSYGDASDMWSLGVVVYMLLVGYPPFHGDEEAIFTSILDASYSVTGSRWQDVSPNATNFVCKLLEKDPTKRLSAREAFYHPWITRANDVVSAKAVPNSPARCLSASVVESLRRYPSQARLQRIVFTLMAFALTTSELDPEVFDAFWILDPSKEGRIRFGDLLAALQSTPDGISTVEAQHIFKSLDPSRRKEISFSEFAAVLVASHIDMYECLIREIFLKLDVQSTGYLSYPGVVSLFRDELPMTYISRMFAEVDNNGDSLIDYIEFKQLIARDAPEMLRKNAVTKGKLSLATHSGKTSDFKESSDQSNFVASSDEFLSDDISNANGDKDSSLSAKDVRLLGSSPAP